jgi:beta-hydroxylase
MNEDSSTAPNVTRENARHFKDERAYPFLQPLRDNWRIFREEVDAFLADDKVHRGSFEISTSGRRAMRSAADLWKTIGFISHGRDPAVLALEHDIPVPILNERLRYVRKSHFKRTRAFLFKYAALPENGVVSAFLSLMDPGARLGLHINHDPYMYRSHLGLLIPEGEVAFRVKDETIKWAEGELLVFAPTDPHSAWNLSDEPRVLLIVDFFRPEEDRAKMVAMEREQFREMMATDPRSFGMSGGMFDLDEDVKRRYAIPRIETT